MTENTEALAVFHFTDSAWKEIGSIVLNGYSINDESPLGLPQGTLRSFRIVRGNFWDSWFEQRPLAIAADDGVQITVRIAALPADSESYGLVEYL